MESKDEKLTKERKEALDKIDGVYEAEHSSNKKKLKYGVYCLFAVPSVFLIMLFFIDTSKLVFLVLWIASLFLISAYLIGIEYSDFRLQENFAGILNEQKEFESLIDVPDITDIDVDSLNKPMLPMLPRLDLYRQERERREQADANVEMLMKQVADLTEKLNQIQAVTGLQTGSNAGLQEAEIEDKSALQKIEIEDKAALQEAEIDDKSGLQETQAEEKADSQEEQPKEKSEKVQLVETIDLEEITLEEAEREIKSADDEKKLEEEFFGVNNEAAKGQE